MEVYFDGEYTDFDKTKVINFIAELEKRNVTVVMGAPGNGYNFNMSIENNHWTILNGQTIRAMFNVEQDGTIMMYYNIVGGTTESILDILNDADDDDERDENENEESRTRLDAELRSMME